MRIRSNVFCYVLVCIALSFAGCRKEAQKAERDFKTLGLAAHDLLSGDSYASLVLELTYMPGCAPGHDMLQQLEDFLNAHIHKPGGIRMVQKEIPSSNKSVLSLKEIVAIEKASRSQYTKETVLAVHILITDSYTTDTNALATSYWNTSICLLGAAIDAQANGLDAASKTNFVTSLLAHEFGHLFGLVNQGSPMFNPHEDTAHPAHCENSSCLMYHTVETSATASHVPAFDPLCLIDLRANGGK